MSRGFSHVTDELALSVRRTLEQLEEYFPLDRMKFSYRPATAVMCGRCGITGGTKPMTTSDPLAKKGPSPLLRLIWEQSTQPNGRFRGPSEQIIGQNPLLQPQRTLGDDQLAELDDFHDAPRFMQRHVEGTIDQHRRQKGACPLCRVVFSYVELEEGEPHREPRPAGVCAECRTACQCDAHQHDYGEIREGDALYREIL